MKLSITLCQWLLSLSLFLAFQLARADEQGAHAVVFDIDGTLTTSDQELWDHILFGTDPDVNTGAQEVARWYESQNVRVIYLTGRPTFLRAHTLQWLSDHGFPEGHVEMVENPISTIPSDDFVGKFKKKYLQRIQSADTQLVAAYGNAKTDICAYAESGIETTRTFIIGPHKRFACPGFDTPIAIESFSEHLLDLGLSSF